MKHGTIAGYTAGCREDCCRRARMRHEKQRRMDRDAGIHYTIDATGTIRRIRALMRIGWRTKDIATQCGWTTDRAVQMILRRDRVNRRTAATVARAYDALSMSLGPSKTTSARAERRGYAPPLAWEDIDDPSEKPRIGSTHVRKTDVDEVVVLRLLAGQRIDCTTAERNEAMRRWLAAGHPEAELCRALGWKDGRYGREDAA